MNAWKATAYVIRSATGKIVVALLTMLIVALLKEEIYGVIVSATLREVPIEIILGGLAAAVALCWAIWTQVY